MGRLNLYIYIFLSKQIKWSLIFQGLISILKDSSREPVPSQKEAGEAGLFPRSRLPEIEKSKDWHHAFKSVAKSLHITLQQQEGSYTSPEEFKIGRLQAKFEKGMVYSPEDFSFDAYQRQRASVNKPKEDIFKRLTLNPLDFYLVCSLFSIFNIHIYIYMCVCVHLYACVFTNL